MSKNVLDRMLEDNQNSTRINQAKLIAKTSAEVALLVVSINGKKVLEKATSKLKTPGPILDFGKGKTASQMLGKAGKLINKGSEKLGRLAFETVKSKTIAKVKNDIKATLPEATLEALKIIEKFREKAATTKNILETFKQAAATPLNANGGINSVSAVLLGEGELTHGVIGYAAKVLKAAEGKPENYALKVLTNGEQELDKKIGQITTDLLADTKVMFESAKEDAEAAEADDRSEAAIKKMREA